MQKRHKKKALQLLSLLLITGVFSTGFIVWADDSITTLSDEQKKAIDDREDELDAIKAKIKAYQNIVNLKQKEGSLLADQLESLEAQAASLQLQIDLNKSTLSQLEGQVASLSTRISEKEGVIRTQKEVLSELMRMYYLDRSQTAFELFFESGENVNPFQTNEWTAETSEQIQELLSQLKTLRQSLVDEQNTLVGKKIEAETLRVKLVERDGYLEGVKNNKARLLAKTETDKQKYDALVDDLEKQREEIESEIEAIESNKIDSLNLKDMPAFKHGLLAYPLKTHTVTQGYGKTSFAKSSGYYKNGFHNGLDFGTPSGTDVMAAADGKVVAVGNNGRYAYGRYIAIDHGNGIITMYGHLSSSKVSRGEKVERGEVVAKSGNTGNSTGPHLHFTVFSANTFDIVASKIVSSLKDIPVGATVNPSVYLP